MRIVSSAGSNGANLSFPQEFNISTDSTDPNAARNQWIVGVINSGSERCRLFMCPQILTHEAGPTLHPHSLDAGSRIPSITFSAAEVKFHGKGTFNLILTRDAP